jgi:uncharacterized FAD-dependent dehydrogenase
LIKTITLTVSPREENDERLLKELAAKEARCSPSELTALVLQKKSIDARHGRVKLHLRFNAYLGEHPAPAPLVPVWKRPDAQKRVIIVGAGPAGLFAALALLEHGITPVLVEQGKRASLRKRDIAAIGTRGVVHPYSNYCFGEGGAGAFSDGKLYSRSKKRGSQERALAILNHFGAPDSILTDSHPHIGSNKLPSIITEITDKIVSLGGGAHFETRCVDLVLRDSRVAGVVTKPSADGSQNAPAKEILGAAVILAQGHSDGRVYELVQSTAASLSSNIPALEAKTFACGVRVEHPRSVIDSIQYHGDSEGLPAAEYRLTAQIDGRGVYSFCMCPGGIVVPSASAGDEIVLNGMSASERNSKWSNAAIVVETRPEDCGEEFFGSSAALVGLRFRQALEKRAAREGKGQAAPAQRLTDFLLGKESESLPPSSYAPGLVSSRLDQWLPAHIVVRLKKAFGEFDRLMKGFICADALVMAPETRTSTPVRITRGIGYESAAVPGLFPCGEGSGYAGGIISSALDGENAARAVAEKFFAS